ncbi:MAG TPA: MraY family glycosyltransferase, partial [Mariprofundaceae bacterium]|nr:MraY family glycosyltransferase [Mariprofundaceae bacterium]
NSHPARVFMGDTGSLVLGYVLAAVSLLLIKAHGKADTPISPVLMGTLLGLPLADTLYVMGRRVMKGASPFLPDQTHFHHRLMQLGLTHGGVVGTMYAIMMVYGIAALALIRTPAWIQMAALLGLIALTYGLLHCLEKGCVSFALKEADSGQQPSNGQLYQQLTRLTGRTVPWMTWFIPVSLLLPVVSIDVKGNLLIVVGTVMLLAIVLYPWRESRDATWLSGIIYLLVFTPILTVNLVADSWGAGYLLWVAGLLVFWVAIKLYFKRHGRIFLSAGLELLLLLLSWVTPWLAQQLGLIPAALQSSLYLTCFESVVFLLATKIVLRHQPRRNRPLLVSMLVVNALLFL